MTPEQMCAALGAGWVMERAGTKGEERPTLPGVADGMTVWEGGGHWFVEVGAHHYRHSYYWTCATAEAAVAVAGLLVLAEETASGHIPAERVMAFLAESPYNG